ncbi:DUF411 domain-containing protein [Microbulbifer sp. SH-1]|uniref:DUF411 domain-containing protein n=1 Tax=Microbulbifer sp. SH-1 TaxID=2681547 RepID=UPI001409F949|nr:DUF411 domain-containing protein [Microbulbifer sp. SH-1]QIL90258.1 DUF411 domain-containing protein [Microbulbifer sp. SH-1]
MKINRKTRGALIALLLGVFTLSACSETGQNPKNTEERATKSSSETIALTTYKSATCGCCKLWVEHAGEQGFTVDARDVDDLNGIKERFRIAPEYQSCHTSVSENDYVFEGHVPAKYIRQFLQNPPANARGLAVPAMPLGSPGMEVGDRFTAYDILLLQSDGSHRVYARIDNPQQQH